MTALSNRYDGSDIVPALGEALTSLAGSSSCPLEENQQGRMTLLRCPHCVKPEPHGEAVERDSGIQVSEGTVWGGLQSLPPRLMPDEQGQMAKGALCEFLNCEQNKWLF